MKKTEIQEEMAESFSHLHLTLQAKSHRKLLEGSVVQVQLWETTEN